MAKSRTANRGWRSRMKKHLAENPELQAKVKALRVERLEAQVVALQETQTSVSDAIEATQAKIAELSATPAE